MSEYTGPPIPVRMQRLPRDVVGRPIPWFVADVGGVRDPRIADHSKRLHALRFGNCWVCGQQTGKIKAFVLGPMCAVNRVTAEPGCHRDCAIYSATACPFLAVPNMRRRDTGLADLPGHVPPPGVMLTRNPGACLVWTTDRWHPMATDTGTLISLGDPIETLWFARGQAATGAQVRASIESGLPLLRDACQADDDPAQSLRDLEREVAAAMRLLPA